MHATTQRHEEGVRKICIPCLYKKHSECHAKQPGTIGPCDCPCVNIEGLSYIELVDKQIGKRRRGKSQALEETVH
jgi:hypothetical protein